MACPNCGNQITIEPSGALPSVTADTPERVAEPKRESSSRNLLLVVVSSLVAATVLGVVVIWILAPDRPEAVVPKTAPSQPAATVASGPKILTPEPATLAAPNRLNQDDEPRGIEKGLGLTLDQFKRDVPIGESWKVLSDTKRDDGTVVLQLISTTMRDVVLVVSGNPKDLSEVSVTFAAITGHNKNDTLLRITVMAFFMEKYSKWTAEELGLFWGRLIKVGEGDESEFRIQKNGHEFWVIPMGVKEGTMFMTGVSVEPDSTAPTLQKWLDDHPVPVAR